jgi:putative copper export protein
LRRFSWMALGAAALVVATGILDAGFLVDGAAALVFTGYGRLLLAKTGFVTGMIALGALNRLVLLPTLGGANEGRGLAGLRQRIAAEIGLGCAAIAVAAVLGLLSPSR